MYTYYTYQDWLHMGGGGDAAKKIVQSYRASDFFVRAINANRYFNGQNPTLDDKWLLNVQTEEKKDENGFTRRYAVQRKIMGNRISSSFIRRFVVQQNQYLLGNGVSLDSPETKQKLGLGFDNALQMIGERALLHGVCYGFWNADHLEPLAAAVDPLSGCVALLDEMSGAIGTAIQFWQLSPTRPLYMRVFEPDGVTVYSDGAGEDIRVTEEKRPYVLSIRRDALGARVVGGANPEALPVIPLYANDTHESELTHSIITKINAYDRIMSDFGDNLDRANDVYWVLNNFGGSTAEALRAIQEIQELKVAMSISDGTSTASAEPKTIDVPYAARQTALALLEKSLYSDFMAVSMEELTGGSLTNVAIQAALTNLNLKCDRYEWQCFRFVQMILRLVGIETEDISFERLNLLNKSETIQDIYMMRSDIDRETALMLNPYIPKDRIEEIKQNVIAEEVSGQPDISTLQGLIDAG